MNESTECGRKRSQKCKIISQDLRELLIGAVIKDAERVIHATKRLHLNKTTAYTIVSKYKKDGQIGKKRRGGCQKLKLDSQM